MKALVIYGVALAVSLTGLAKAADVTLPSDQVIAARQAGFDLQQGVAAAMKAGVASGADVKQYVDGAKGIASWGKVIPAMFPAGTESGHDTKAKPEIWSDKAGFQKAADNLVTQADKLVTLADAGDKDGFAAQFKETAAACGACHKQYKNR